MTKAEIDFARGTIHFFKQTSALVDTDNRSAHIEVRLLIATPWHGIQPECCYQVGVPIPQDGQTICVTDSDDKLTILKLEKNTVHTIEGIDGQQVLSLYKRE